MRLYLIIFKCPRVRGSLGLQQCIDVILSSCVRSHEFESHAVRLKLRFVEVCLWIKCASLVIMCVCLRTPFKVNQIKERMILQLTSKLVKREAIGFQSWLVSYPVTIYLSTGLY